MSSGSVPRSVQRESTLAASETLFTLGQRKAVRKAVNYCSVVCPQIADIESLLLKAKNSRHHA
jgi:hypothetical protein